MTSFAGYRPGLSAGRLARSVQRLCCIVLLALPFSSPALASSTAADETPSQALPLERIALELENPVTGLRSIAWDMKYTSFQGDLPEADDQSVYSNVFTPSWPIKLSNGKHLLLRAQITITGDEPGWKPSFWIDYPEWLIRQLPNIDETTGAFVSGHSHLDNLSFDIGYGGVDEHGVISMISLANVAPTSDDQSAMREQWLIGPEIALGKITDWGLYGMRAKHLTDIWTSSNLAQGIKYDTNETTLKLFFAYSLGNGWQIEANPTIFYDWEAVSGNEWTIPFGAGVSKTFRIGSVPLQLGLEIQKHVVSPDRFGPDWLVNLNVTPVLSTRLLQ